ncbi:MAG: (d)CMP kinase [Acidobacteria bacterium]|nr:(d)CMP kinase [Acidobacteriota bacterium]
MVIAIDGPSGVGKSTVARAVASRLGLSYVESGAMYRAVALAALETGTPLDDADALGAIAARADFRFETSASGNRLWLNGRDVTEAIRSAEVTRAASIVSTHALVRAHLVERQRALGAAGGVVMEGRDIGTVVFPVAEVKIFLDASPEVRGQRRLKDQESAAASSAEAILREIAERDRRDQTREISPLASAPDAVRIDTTQLTADEVADQIAEIAGARRRGADMEITPGNQ